MRTLSQRELNRATLARQLLLERRRLPVVTAIERIAGLQGQWVPAPFVGLWSRLEGFRREALDQALNRGAVRKALMMRGTLHLVSERDYPLFSAALHGGGASPVNADAMALGERVADGLRALFANGPRSRAEVLAWLDEAHPLATGEVRPLMSWYALRICAHVVHAPSAAQWDGPARPRFVLLDGVVLPQADEARTTLVRRYLAAFGPATRADIADWSGLRIRDIEPALAALEPLRRFRDPRDRELLDLPRAPLPPADTPAPARLLPKWDSVLLGHADRSRVLPEQYRKTIIAKNGDVAQTMLVDGMVAGTWSLVGGRVQLAPFAPVPLAARRALQEEAARLETFVR